jgi:antitoxin CptB
MDLPDNDLLDLLLARQEPRAELDRPEVHEVLAQMRKPPSPSLPRHANAS